MGRKGHEGSKEKSWKSLAIQVGEDRNLDLVMELVRNDFHCCEFYNWYTVWVSHGDRKSVGGVLSECKGRKLRVAFRRAELEVFETSAGSVDLLARDRNGGGVCDCGWQHIPMMQSY